MIVDEIESLDECLDAMDRILEDEVDDFILSLVKVWIVTAYSRGSIDTYEKYIKERGQ